MKKLFVLLLSVLLMMPIFSSLHAEENRVEELAWFTFEISNLIEFNQDTGAIDKQYKIPGYDDNHNSVFIQGEVIPKEKKLKMDLTTSDAVAKFYGLHNIITTNIISEEWKTVDGYSFYEVFFEEAGLTGEIINPRKGRTLTYPVDNTYAVISVSVISSDESDFGYIEKILETVKWKDDGSKLFSSENKTYLFELGSQGDGVKNIQRQLINRYFIRV